MLPSREHVPVQVMPDDHSKSVPPLPIPNRTVKRYYADDSAATSVKVGYRQASYKEKAPCRDAWGFFRFGLENPPSDLTRSRSRQVQTKGFFSSGRPPKDAPEISAEAFFYFFVLCLFAGRVNHACGRGLCLVQIGRYPDFRDLLAG